MFSQINLSVTIFINILYENQGHNTFVQDWLNQRMTFFHFIIHIVSFNYYVNRNSFNIDRNKT